VSKFVNRLSLYVFVPAIAVAALLLVSEAFASVPVSEAETRFNGFAGGEFLMQEGRTRGAGSALLTRE
jgi:hypothetical protein